MAAEPAANNLGFKTPPGFEVTLFADDTAAHDIFSLAIDARGRVAVSGPGYVKLLPDDGSGKAGRPILFSERPKTGAQGMYFDGPDLICSGDGAIWRLRDSQGVDHADEFEMLIPHLANSEHGAHTIVKGPDGWLYAVCGNDAGVNSTMLKSKRSPVVDPIAGAILRFTPDVQKCEVFADGFRNPYALDFNANGHLFTVDSDNERDHYLPWYAPTRLFDVAQGREHGWLLKGFERSWNRPASFFDNVPRLYEIGRGSPTGLVCYRHQAFPEHYQGGVFSACWTLGKVYFFPLKPSGETYETRLETFMEPEGNSGFAPTGLAVGPTGDLFISVGGRGTRGSVYRVRYVGAATPLAEAPNDPVTRILRAPQPLSSWSRAKWEPELAQLKETSRATFAAALADPHRGFTERLRAAEVLCGMPHGLTESLLASLENNPHDRALEQAARRLYELHAARRASSLAAPTAGGTKNQATSSARAPTPPTAGENVAAEKNPAEKIAPENMTAERIAAEASVVLRVPDARARLVAARKLQIALGDVGSAKVEPELYAGYRPRFADITFPGDRAETANLLTRALPSDSAELDREIARTLGLLAMDVPELPLKLLAHVTAESLPQDDLHFLIVLSLIPGERSAEVTQRTAAALANLHHKMLAREWLPSRNWPLRVGELFQALVARDANLPDQLGSAKSFDLPDQALFVLRLTGPARERLARQLLAAVRHSPAELEWTPQFIEALKALPRSEFLSDLRLHWDEPALRDSIATVLVEHPVPQDRARLLQTLGSVQGKIVAEAAGALLRLDPQSTPDELSAALKALRQLCQAPQEKGARQAVAALLAAWSGEQVAVDEGDQKNLLAAYEGWFAWFAKAYPQAAAKLRASTTYDQQAWLARLAKIDFDKGDATLGKAVFERRNCVKCHQGAGKLGPDLAGAATRFSREDLFIAILDPSKDVAPLYRAKIVTTSAGQSYTGLIVYQSPEGLLLQTGPDTTIRINQVPEGGIRTSAVSPMPTGLLNEATDVELANLYAFLRSLKK
jgi:putative heme-binding domain-containing protein